MSQKITIGPFLIIYEKSMLNLPPIEEETRNEIHKIRDLLKDVFGISLSGKNSCTAILAEVEILPEKLKREVPLIFMPEHQANFSFKKQTIKNIAKKPYMEDIPDETDWSSSVRSDLFPIFPYAYGAARIRVKGVLEVEHFLNRDLFSVDIKLAKDEDPDVFIPLMLKYGFFDRIQDLPLGFNSYKFSSLPSYLKKFFTKGQNIPVWSRLRLREIYRTLEKLPLFVTSSNLFYSLIESLQLQRLVSETREFEISNTPGMLLKEVSPEIWDVLWHEESVSHHPFQGMYVFPYPLALSNHNHLTSKAIFDEMLINFILPFTSKTVSNLSDFVGSELYLIQKTRCGGVYLVGSPINIEKIQKGTILANNVSSIVDTGAVSILNALNKNQILLKTNVDVPYLKDAEIARKVYSFPGFSLFLRNLEGTLFGKSAHVPIMLLSSRPHFEARVLTTMRLNAVDILEQFYVHHLLYSPELSEEEKKKYREKLEYTSELFTSEFRKRFIATNMSLTQYLIKLKKLPQLNREISSNCEPSLLGEMSSCPTLS